MWWIALSLISSVLGVSAYNNDAEPAEMRRAREGNIAIQEELDAARKAATVDAYDLFIARHPDHPLAQIAREERQCLIDRQKGHKP